LRCTFFCWWLRFGADEFGAHLSRVVGPCDGGSNTWFLAWVAFPGPGLHQQRALLFRGVDLTLEGVNSGACVCGALVLRSLLRRAFRARYLSVPISPPRIFTVLLQGLPAPGRSVRQSGHVSGRRRQLPGQGVSCARLAGAARDPAPIRSHASALAAFVSDTSNGPLRLPHGLEEVHRGTALHVEQTDLCRSSSGSSPICSRPFRLPFGWWTTGGKLMPVASTSLSKAKPTIWARKDRRGRCDQALS